MSWAEEELKYTDLGDQRRNQRLVKIVEDLIAQPNASVPQASRDNAAMQGMYDFWANRRIRPLSILEGHSARTVERCLEHPTVLSIQDTTELDFSGHPGTRGLGAISDPSAIGLKVHITLCCSDAGVPLGILNETVWAREKTRRGRGYRERKAAIEEKESYRWLEHQEESQKLIPETVEVITITDREGDIYELFAQPRRPKSEFLIRAAQNRSTKSDAYGEEVTPLFDAIRQQPCQGHQTLALQRTPKRTPRLATLSVRYATLWLQPPQGHPKASELGAIAVQVVLAEEEHPPEGEKAISWLLLTTLPVNSFEDACQCLIRYSRRWVIERYNFVLKSGCRLEELQLETADRLERALATYSIVAWRLLWLTYEARVNPDASVETVLEEHEWQALYCTIHQTTVLPPEPPSIGQCVRWIAKLGGFLGRKGDGDPGVKTLWRGLQRLNDIAATWKLLRGLEG